ncbi:hypothetical protein [Corynebacterium liangguodongii]|uniref:Uncharacterized protein n=1 Tax=Corynebacterium liangguodongii TaxID=2079535 RepID=A0A2S0WGX6_9CORY|nr:hypothetical protein [Corynebacterium liangguodongii]AWB84932.1 hypothetical protein C3E79_11000 [Corynebacterium liangguodongii]PWB99360.1 hypothetical protein DF219_07275 [Corynebacterium liangguodongii]
MSRPYEIDRQWLEAVASDEDARARVRLTATGAHARDAVMQWLEDQPVDALGVRGRGAWIVQEVSAGQGEAVVDITAGGDDLAGSLSEATEEAYAVLSALGCELTWEELGRE